MRQVLAAVVAVGCMSAAASAQMLTFTASLSGLNERPNPVTTPATGAATLQIDVATRAFTMDVVFSGLTAGMTVAHIHRGPASGTGAPFIWLDGMPPVGGPGTTPFIPMGSQSFNGTLAGIFPQADLDNLLAGNTYVNIHSSNFPGGEIRGQLVPGPGAAGLLAVAGLLAARRRR